MDSRGFETTEQTRPLAPRGGRQRTLAIVAVILLLTTLGTGIYSLAIFTSSTTVTNNAFTAGTITIGATPATALFNVTAMMPGDSSTQALTVSNSGTGQLRYAMTTSATNTDTKGLRDQATLVIKTKDTNTSGCTNFNGTQLYTGTLASAALGDVTAGGQAGDRTLDAATSEVLCFQVGLPLSTGNAFQGATTTATFTFQAEQTANNP